MRIPKLNGAVRVRAAKENQAGPHVSGSFTPPGQTIVTIARLTSESVTAGILVCREMMLRLLDLIGDHAPALYFAILNLPRYVRYWPGGACCESCGIYNPLSRLAWPRFRNGQRLPVCVECDDFHVLIDDMAEMCVFDRRAA